MKRPWLRRGLLVTLVLTIGLLFVALRTPGGPRPLRVFEPGRMADLELDMWQAYYAHENVRLFGDLLTTLREQYGYSWARASLGGFYLARAARTFGDARSGYERVLPDLERAYAMVKGRSGAAFDPAAVARAELNWWVARRVPGQDDAENVGRLIAAENALLFEVPIERVLEASTLRARAGRLRDEGGAEAEWRVVSQLLHQSYEQLHAAVQR
ncbi:MAG: hypothetical protein ABJA98_32145 [Acidobacteriota bacterium]